MSLLLDPLNIHYIIQEVPEPRLMSDNNDHVSKTPKLKNVKSNYYSVGELHQLIQNNDNDKFILALNNTLNILYRANDGESFLMMACQFGSLKCVQFLLDSNVDKDYISKVRKNNALMWTILHCNENNNRNEIIRLLLIHGANPNIRSLDSNETAFEIAMKSNHLSIVSLFLEMGFDPNNSSLNGISPLIWVLKAKTNNNTNIDALGKLLVQRGVKLPLDYSDENTGDKLLHLLASTDNSFLEDVLLHDDIINQLYEGNNINLTPILIAIKHNKPNNIKLFYKTDPNILKSPNLLETALKFFSWEVLALLLHLGIDFSYRSNWLEWTFNNTALSYKNIIDSELLVFNIINSLFKMDPDPYNISIAKSDSCTCSSFHWMTQNLCDLYINSMLTSSKKSVNLKTDVGCHTHGSLIVKLFNNHIRTPLANQQVDKILLLFLQFGLDPNLPLYSTENMANSDIASNFPLFHCHTPTQAEILLKYGAKISKPITHFPPISWKILTLHLKMNVNSTVYGTEEDIADIPHSEFFILKNGICWDLKSLREYITITVKGKNIYDPKSPWPGQKIWNNFDIQNLHKLPLNLYAKSITDFINVADIYHAIPKDFIDLWGECASIFWARGKFWDDTIAVYLIPSELNEWTTKKNDTKSGLQNSSMPAYMSNNLAKKLEKLKQEYLFKFHVAYMSLDDDVTKNILPKVDPEIFTPRANPKFEHSFLDGVFKGIECIMITGSKLSFAHNRLTSWIK